jgi:hypothetical protein
VQQSLPVVHAPSRGTHAGGGGAHVPPTQELPQHAASVVQLPPSGRHGSEQRKTPSAPAAHTPVQQSVPRAQTPSTGTHARPGGPHRPPEQTRPQHSPAVVHAAPSGTHASMQTRRPAASSPQMPVQHSAVDVHVSPSARQLPPRWHRRETSSQIPEQQWSAPPELHSSPPGRHSTESSISQRLRTQLCEQQSASTAQSMPSLVVVQTSPPHTPP